MLHYMSASQPVGEDASQDLYTFTICEQKNSVPGGTEGEVTHYQRDGYSG